VNCERIIFKTATLKIQCDLANCSVVTSGQLEKSFENLAGQISEKNDE
jgi:hypothetical protein